MMWFSFSWQKNIMRPYLLAVFMWKAPPPLSKLPLLPSPPSFLPTSSLLPSPSASPPPGFQFTINFQLNWIQLHLSASPGPLYPTQLTEICESWSQHWASDLCGSGPSLARRTSGCNPRARSGPANMAHEKRGGLKCGAWKGWLGLRLTGMGGLCDLMQGETDLASFLPFPPQLCSCRRLAELRRTPRTLHPDKGNSN